MLVSPVFHFLQYFVAMKQSVVEIEWSTLRNLWSYSDYPCNLAVAPPHCFTALQSTLHNRVWPLQITEIQLGMDVQLNFSCLCEGHTSVEYPGWIVDSGWSVAAILWEQCMHYFIVMDEFLQQFKYNILCYSTFCNQRAVMWLWVTDEPCSNLTIVSYV
jgi:hypothetical protein